MSDFLAISLVLDGYLADAKHAVAKVDAFLDGLAANEDEPTLSLIDCASADSTMDAIKHDVGEITKTIAGMRNRRHLSRPL